MKKYLVLSLLILASILSIRAEENISIETSSTQLVLRTSDDGRVYQVYFGKRLTQATSLDLLNQPKVSQTSTSHYGWEVYPVMGTGGFYEAAFEIRHADGNPTSVLKYVSHTQEPVDGGVKTTIELRDESYPVKVTLYYIAYTEEDIIKQWSEISHEEDGDVYISRYASSMLYFESPRYYLEEFVNDWAREMRLTENELTFGKKIIDSRLGARADMLVAPFFEIGVGQQVYEDEGEVLMGTLGWTGNFRFTFEVDHNHALRVINGINPDASNYMLRKGEIFTTPEAIYTLSFHGVGAGSRNFYRWAKKYQLPQGINLSHTLLNNWETTGFSFTEDTLVSLFDEAQTLGIDLFLLDDGWFGGQRPRNNDHTSLGDWESTPTKLPHGIPFLLQQATDRGIEFGLWIEPEMVSPKSELAAKHPDWILLLPQGDTHYFRNQLVLDLTNPQVQDFVFSVVDDIMKDNPNLKFIKWDCNSPIINAFSPYEREYQGRLYVDYVRGLYNVLQRVQAAYPHLEMMLCSGGGGRADYEALQYFSEFWPSDNTDPIERLFIQWGYSQFMPPTTMCAHVTSWNSATSIKFRVDVAFPYKLGFDINLAKLSADERQYCKAAIEEHKRLLPLLSTSNVYRLVSPYDGEHCVLEYLSDDSTHALLFAYDILPRYAEEVYPTRLTGFIPDAYYRVKEICLMLQQQSAMPCHDRVYSGEYLNTIGLKLLSSITTSSHIVEITREE